MVLLSHFFKYADSGVFSYFFQGREMGAKCGQHISMRLSVLNKLSTRDFFETYLSKFLFQRVIINNVGQPLLHFVKIHRWC